MVNTKENTQKFKNLINKLVYIEDDYGDTVMSDRVLIYNLKRNTYKEFEIRFDKFESDIFTFQFHDNSYKWNYLKFFKNLRIENQEKIIEWIEEYIVTNS